MNIGFRHVPFNDEQRAALDAIAHDAGRGTIWFSSKGDPSIEELATCEALMGYFPPATFKSLPELRWVQTPAAGVDRLCGDIYARKDVVLTNGSGAFGIDIAEYVVGGVLSLFRHLPAYHTAQAERSWGRQGVGRSICDSTVCVIGCGNVGSTIAERMKALGAACVRGMDRTRDIASPAFDEHYLMDEPEAALAGADIVAVSLPSTPETQKLVSARFFECMNEGTVFANVGRGVTVDQDALTAALQEGKIAGAVLDVFEVEPLPQESPLWGLENVIVTPHVAGWDDDLVNVRALFEIFRENLTRYLAGDELTHVVDRARGY